MSEEKKEKAASKSNSSPALLIILIALVIWLFGFGGLDWVKQRWNSAQVGTTPQVAAGQQVQAQLTLHLGNKICVKGREAVTYIHNNQAFDFQMGDLVFGDCVGGKVAYVDPTMLGKTVTVNFSDGGPPQSLAVPAAAVNPEVKPIANGTPIEGSTVTVVAADKATDPTRPGGAMEGFTPTTAPALKGQANTSVEPKVQSGGLVQKAQPKPKVYVYADGAYLPDGTRQGEAKAPAQTMVLRLWEDKRTEFGLGAPDVEVGTTTFTYYPNLGKWCAPGYESRSRYWKNDRNEEYRDRSYDTSNGGMTCLP